MKNLSQNMRLNPNKYEAIKNSQGGLLWKTLSTALEERINTVNGTLHAKKPEHLHSIYYKSWDIRILYPR